jgi:polygalacturonase
VGGTVRFTDDGQRTSAGDGRAFYTQWFGSDPNGVDESCQAIQATLDAAPSGAVVQLGQGVYKCSANTLTLSKPLTLRGTHRRESRIYWTGATTGAVINIPFATEQATIEKLGIRLATTGIAAYGIWAQGPQAHVQEVMIQPERASRVFGTACIRTSDTSRIQRTHVSRSRFAVLHCWDSNHEWYEYP